MSDCKKCSDREFLADLRISQNNPKEYSAVFGRDHGKTMLLGDLVEKFTKASRKGATDRELCDLIDREFLFGCWRHELEARDPFLLRDLRGIIIKLLHQRKA